MKRQAVIHGLVAGLFLVLAMMVSGAALASEGPFSLLKIDPSTVTRVAITDVTESGTSSQTLTKLGGNWVADGRPAKGVEGFLAFLSIMGVDAIAGPGDFGFAPQAGAWTVALQFADGTGTIVEFGGLYTKTNGWFSQRFTFVRTGHGPVCLEGEFDMVKLLQLKQGIK